MNKIIMPLGIDSFEEIREGGYYYVDKTNLISELLKKTFKVNLFTRPRRFGKTLAMDTLASFLDIRRETKELFAGLNIEKDKELCRFWQNQWPVIFLTLKELEDAEFEAAEKKFAMCISDLYKRHLYLLESDKIESDDRKMFRRFQFREADAVELQNSLNFLMRMMNAYFGKQAVVLIDEYDVPLAKANENGFYNQMLNILQGFMNKSLKNNSFLKFAVITGCLRISKESIFTGTNNFVSDTISGERFNEYFGFTEAETAGLLKDTGFLEHAEEMKLWYDGYHFGSVHIYCPWDVLNHINALQDAPDTPPKNYWEDTSHNGILRTFIELANDGSRPELDVNDKFEALLAGQCIREPIEENLTYDTLHSSESNLWSLLYLTGYLTQAEPLEQPKAERTQADSLALRIPNEEVKVIFRKTVLRWFQERIVTVDRKELFAAMWQGNAKKATEIISDLLFNTISYYDYKEDFYHAFLAGIFTGGGYIVQSNREHGYGRTDITIRERSHRRAMIIEAKHAETEQRLETECKDAVKQIDERRYAAEFQKGYQSVICYGIAFFEKQCLVMKFDERKN